MTTRVEICKRLLLINSASTVVTQLVRVTVLVWLHQHLLRRISPEEYVLYPIVVAVVAFLPLFTGILTSGLGRYIVEAYARDEESRIVEIVSTMFTLLLPLGLLFMLVGGLASWHVEKILTIAPGRVWDARLMLMLSVFSLAVQLPAAPFGLGMYVRQKFVLANLILLGAELLKSTLLFVLLLAVSTRVLWVPVATVVGQVCCLIVTVMVSRRLVRSLRYRRDAVRWDLVSDIVGFGGWNFLAAAGVRIQESVVPLVLNELASPVHLASFQVGTMGRRQINHWMDVTSRPLYPIVTGMHATGAKDRLRSVYLRGGRINLWLVAIVAVPAMVYARELMDLYVGPAYSDGAHVLALTLVSTLLGTGSAMVWKLSTATAQVRPLGIRVFVSQVAVLGGTVYLVGWLHMGAVGAALATLLVSAVTHVFFIWPLALRMADVKAAAWFRETIVPGLLPTCVGGIVWMILRATVMPATWGAVGLCVGAGCLFYVGTLLRFSMAPIDRLDLMRILAKAGPFARVGRLAVGEIRSGS